MITVDMGMHLRRSANCYADRTAMVYGGRRFTCREFNQRGNVPANSLISLGAKKGDRAACLSANRHQVIGAAHASYKAGLVEVPLNFRLSMGELVHMLNNSESSVLILGEEFIEAVEFVRELPKNPYRKILRRILREKHRGKQTRMVH